MLMRSDPFRELDRLAQQVLGSGPRALALPLDAYRQGDRFVLHVDVPGVDPSSIDLTVEKNVLTVSAERRWQPADDVQVVASERPQGTFSRQLFLGEGLDTDRIEAGYDAGVLTITVPVAEQARARKVEIATGGGHADAIEAEATAA